MHLVFIIVMTKYVPFFSDSDNIQPFLDFIYSLHQNIKFTIGYAKNTFTFLNVELNFNDFSFGAYIYRKQAHTIQMIHFKYFHFHFLNRSALYQQQP